MNTSHRPWSFSSLTLYESCPHKYKLKYIDKQPEPELGPDAPTVRGNRVHEGLENYLQFKGDLPVEAESLRATYDELRTNNTLIIEQEWGFNKDWIPVASWQDPDISCRMKLDVFYTNAETCHVIDHKTGKISDIKHAQQAQLYCIGASSLFPNLAKFTTTFLYVDQGKAKTTSYPKAAVEKFQQSFDKRVAKLWADETFRPISNKFNCKWCPFGTNGTAVCEYRSEE